jgi:hypothetical protein
MPRSDVYDPDAFAYRVTFAAAVIARGGETTRRFDATGEMNDGEAVTAALVRRAKANPGGNLARNLFRYIGEEQALDHYEETKHLTVRGLTEYAATLRADAQKASDKRQVERAAERSQSEASTAAAAQC